MDAFVVKVAKLCMPAGGKETTTEEEKTQDNRPVEESATAEESTARVEEGRVEEDIVDIIQPTPATTTVEHTGNNGSLGQKSVQDFLLDASNIRLNTPPRTREKAECDLAFGITYCESKEN